MKDILLNDNGEIQIVNGDLKVGEADDQNVGFIFEGFKGEMRSTPALGFGAAARLKKIDNVAQFKRDLKVELERDGYKNSSIELSRDLQSVTITVK